MLRSDPEKSPGQNTSENVKSHEVKIEEETINQSVPKTALTQDQFVGAGNAGRDFVSGLAASNIDDIIEEEEEEEEDEAKEFENVTNCDRKKASDENKDCDKLSVLMEEKEEESLEQPTVIEVYGENTKFILEPVVLESEADNKSDLESVKNEENVQNDEEKVDSKESKDEDQEDEAGKTIKEESDSNEIRVEEGYATRQMDEFFRQTIAQIKEELTKKLENNNPDEDEDIGDFSDEDADSDYDDEDDDEFDEDDIENQRFNENEAKSYLQSYRAKRNALYQQLLAPKKQKSASGKHQLSQKVSSWLALLGCIINMIIVEGMCFNYLNLFNLVQEEYGISSKLIASLPTSFLVGSFLLVSPLALFMAKNYGSKNVAFIGAIVSSVSLLVSSFQENIIEFTITYGVVTGIGMGLVYIPSLLSISKWFLKDRLLASSLAILGTSVGAAFYPILSDFLIRKYEFYGSLLILSAVHLNCLVGSMLLSENNVPYSLFDYNLNKKSASTDAKSLSNSTDQIKPRKKEGFKPKTASLTFLVENEVADNTPIIEVTDTSIDKKAQNKQTRDYNFRKLNNQKRQNALRRNILLADAKSETQSTISTSTASYNNYTLKQYWRKFVQTRQNNSNAKKNLFHLMAEEKKKTKTMSKTSLDGFVITTSNNLLAPNDEENVIIFARQAEILENIKNSKATSEPQPMSAASRFLARIANSIRSLTQSSHINQNSGSNFKIPQTDESSASQKLLNLNLNKSSRVNINGDKNDEKLNEVTKSNDQLKEQLPLQLISVFDGPITDEEASNAKNEENAMPANLASVFTPVNNLENDLHTNLISPNEINYSETNSDEEENDQRTDVRTKSQKKLENDDDDDDTPQNYVKNYNKSNGATPSSILKNSRYFSYRSSLTNSVRGSLMEYTVPEDGVHNEFDLDNNNLDSASINFNKPRYSRYLNKNSNRYNNQSNQKISQNATLKSYKNANSDGLFSLTFNSLLMNTRRFVSTIDSSGMFNFPINLESVEHNLRNALIKKNSDYYRRNNKPFYNKSGDECKSFHTLLAQYLKYLFSLNLFFNQLLFFINVSFFFNIIGFYVTIIYFGEFCERQKVSKPQSLYILFLIILMQGLGRIFSTLLFKCNESSAKGRIFTYNLSLICLGLIVLCSTVLCDTVFSLTMFAIIYGSLHGFNSNLRSTFIYDVLGLNWSDDCLFSYASITQGIAVLVGLPIAGFIHDYTNNYLSVYYLSGICFIISGLILTRGKKLTVLHSKSYKALNRFYFQRK